MRLGRLALKVYLYSVGTGLATIAVFVLSFHFLVRQAHRDPFSIQLDHLIADAWEQGTNSSVDRPQMDGPFPAPPVTLYDRKGRLISSTNTQPISMLPKSRLGELETVDHLDLEGGIVARAIRKEGELVGVGLVALSPGRLPGPPGLNLALPLGALSLLFLAATALFARHIARPLEQLASNAKSFGRGALGARSSLQRMDEIGDLGRAFDDMAERVTRLMSAQQELLINVSHELLTPMSRIRIAVDLIADGNAGEAHEMVREITHDLLELERLLDDVMTVAKFDLSNVEDDKNLMPLRPSPLLVSSVVEKAVLRFRSQCETHPVVVETKSPLPAIHADLVLLRRVVENLLENARKYSEVGSEIRVSSQASATHVEVSVEDRGMGIEQADLGQVFTPFFRGDRSRSRATGGVGLGLALAIRVVRAHGGNIDIESEPGIGTKVTLRLPFSKED